MDVATSSKSRVFIIEDQAGPAQVPEYMGFARAQAPDWSGGDRTPVRIPDPNRYGRFKVVGFIEGQRGLPSLGIQARYTFDRSDLLRIFRKECSVDLQVHMGECGDVQDFDGGWEKILVLENSRPTNWSAGELGAFDGDQDAAVDEETPFTGLDMYEVLRVTVQEKTPTEVTDEIIDVAICDEVACGACGIPSNGYNKVFALVGPTAESPGLPAEIVYSADGGATWARTNVTTLGVGEAPNAMACVGSNLVVVSNASASLHYAAIADILNGSETWAEVSTGFVAGGEPNAIVSLGRTRTWIVGDGGYVYFSADVTAGVEVQSGGDVTTEDLASVSAYDNDNLFVVGANNAALSTANGGETWQAVTGPAVGVALNAVATRRGSIDSEWFVGDAGGSLWYTRDGGTNWTVKTFPGSGAGQVRDIAFPTPTVGYLAHDTATPRGRIFRSISGGNSWYAIPESNQTFPACDRVTALAVTPENPNLVWGGGLADDGSDGFLCVGQ